MQNKPKQNGHNFQYYPVRICRVCHALDDPSRLKVDSFAAQVKCADTIEASEAKPKKAAK